MRSLSVFLSVFIQCHRVVSFFSVLSTMQSPVRMFTATAADVSQGKKFKKPTVFFISLPGSISSDTSFKKAQDEVFFFKFWIFRAIKSHLFFIEGIESNASSLIICHHLSLFSILSSCTYHFKTKLSRKCSSYRSERLNQKVTDCFFFNFIVSFNSYYSIIFGRGVIHSSSTGWRETLS